MSQSWLKAIHLLGVLCWIGPLLGGWWMLARIDRREDAELSKWARKAFLPLVHIEHLGLVLWLGTGLWMAAQTPYLMKMPWLHIKLGIVVAVIVPLEIWDFVVSHGRLPAALKRGDEAEVAAALDAHRKLCKVSAAVLIPSVIAIFIVAIALKPSLLA